MQLQFSCFFAGDMLKYKTAWKQKAVCLFPHKYKKEGEAMVELDQFKTVLATYTEPLVEVRDSL